MAILSTEELEALGLKAHYVASTGAYNDEGTPALCTDSELVTTWRDRGAGARHLVSSGANRPRFRAAAINGHGALESVNGARVMVTSVNASTMMNVGSATVLCVAKLERAPNAGATYNNAQLWTVNNGKIGLAAKNTPSLMLWNDDGTPDSITPIAAPDFVLGRWYVFASVHSGGNIYQSLDLGSQVSTASGDTSSLASPFVILSNDALAATPRYWRGQLAECQVYDAALSGATLAAVISDLMITYGLGANLPLAEMARVIGSSRLNQACVQVLTPAVTVGMRHALDFGVGHQLALSHHSLPGAAAPASGQAAWQRTRVMVDGKRYNPGFFEGLGGSAPQLLTRSLRETHALHWDVGRTVEGGSNERADGVARLGVQALTLIRGAVKYVDNPADPNQIIAIPAGVEAQALQGHLIERASAGNYQLRSSFASDGTGIPAKSGSGTTTFTASSRYDPDVVAHAMHMQASGTISTAYKQPMPATTTAFGGSDSVWLSLDVYNFTGNTGYVQVIRASDSKYLKADKTWTVTETWLSISTDFILLDSADTWERRALGPFTPGATTVQVIPGVPTTGVGNQINIYAHFQVEVGAWPSSRMISDDEMVTRDLDVFSRANASTPARQFPTASAWTWCMALRHIRAYNDSSTASFTAFSVTYDASNWVRFYFDGASGLYKLEVRVAGTTYTASKASTHARGADEVIAARLTSSDGELGLTAFTASVLVDGVVGTNATPGAFPTASGSPALYICNDGSSNAIDAGLRHNRLVAYAMSDDQISRFP